MVNPRSFINFWAALTSGDYEHNIQVQRVLCVYEEEKEVKKRVKKSFSVWPPTWGAINGQMFLH